ncbi:DNA repair protein RecN [Gallaecimonas sp. GXIMD4217]|uniref:DNA repair protein RecN n=1 Tax=Gallaecimonas sp. GXIMD4217 TaxID=3131927 RepID=UPI00311B0F5D
MLTQLTVSNFAIVRFLELDFHGGLTSITGETGAGKSIAIDALGLCLGDRAEGAMVRPGADKAEVSARFSLAALPQARAWLQGQELDEEDDCIIRRTVTSEGRSRAYINGQPVPVSQLKQLGALLVNIHGQHAHHALLKSDTQLKLLDGYAGHQELLEAVRQSWRSLKATQEELDGLRASEAQREARRQLLEYQVEELDQFALEEGEYQQIEEEHHRQANAANLIQGSGLCLDMLSQNDEVNAADLLRQVLDRLYPLRDTDEALAPVVDLLLEAQVQLDEAASELERYQQRLEIDPERFQELESRMGKAIELARKHKVPPARLPEQHQRLADELKALSDDHQRLDELETELEKCRGHYHQQALKLSQSRIRHGKALAKATQAAVRELALPHAVFAIKVEHQQEAAPSPLGLDRISFEVTTNPGQPLAPMAKVVSGGELSRIGLALQVLTAQQSNTPTLIFDEVDVGISGPTALVVGKLLRRLGEKTQVMCVTHLPQVAGQGHQQMFVQKETKAGQTETLMQALDQEQRITELARLLGGDAISEASRANARELLSL